jgi:hypothetical protein
MNNSNRLLTSLLLAGVILFSRTASAQLEVYDTQSSYDTASFTINTAQFDGSTIAQNSFSFYGNAFSVGDVDFTTPTGTSLIVLGPGVSGYNFPGDGTSTLNAETGTKSVAVTDIGLPMNVLPAGITAVGTEIGDGFGQASITAIVTLTNGMTGTYTFTAQDANTSGLGYLGFVASGGYKIASLSITDTALGAAGVPDLVFDNFSYGVGNPNGPSGTNVPLIAAPEPSTYALLFLGGFALLLFRRRLSLL